MNKFTNTKIGKVILILIVMILISNLIPKVSHASVDVTIGKAFCNVLCWLGDGIVQIVQEGVLGIPYSFIELDMSTSVWAWVLGIGVALIIVAAAVVSAIFTCGGTAVAAAIAGIGAGIGALTSATIVGGIVYACVAANMPDDWDIPNITLSPDAIFTNKIALTDVNFFNPMNVKEGEANLYNEEGDITGKKKIYYIDNNNNGIFEANVDIGTTQSTALVLKQTITKWYYMLRNIALVGLLSVLIYVGIRIIISSAASEKAKYKGMLADWVVGICLVFFIQYIMIFSITIVEKIVGAISSAASPYVFSIHNTEIADYLDENSDELLSRYGFDFSADTGEYVSYAEDGEGFFAWPTNYIGVARLKQQFEAESENEKDTLYTNLGYTIVYLALIFFTIYFLVVYIRRAVYLAFLTLIAPLVALTYPIDKLTDGQAQRI